MIKLKLKVFFSPLGGYLGRDSSRRNSMRGERRSFVVELDLRSQSHDSFYT